MSSGRRTCRVPIKAPSVLSRPTVRCAGTRRGAARPAPVSVSVVRSRRIVPRLKSRGRARTGFVAAMPNRSARGTQSTPAPRGRGPIQTVPSGVSGETRPRGSSTCANATGSSPPTISPLLSAGEIRTVAVRAIAGTAANASIAAVHAHRAMTLAWPRVPAIRDLSAACPRILTGTADGGQTATRKGGRKPPFLSIALTEELLELDRPAGLLELGLQLVGLVALDALLDGLGSLVDQGLGLLQPEAGGRADDLDDLDLLVARAGQDDVDGRGLLLGRCAVAAAARGRGRSGDCRCRHAELLLERLDALGELSDRDALELLDPFLGAGCHQLSPSFEVSFSDSAAAGASASAAGSGSAAGASASAAAASASAGASASASGAASPVTRPCSWIWPSAIAMPESSAFKVRTRPESGFAMRPTSWPCITSRDGSFESASISAIVSSLPSIQPPLNSGSCDSRRNAASAFAASTGSPFTNLKAVGPSRNCLSTSAPTWSAARSVSVFLTTHSVASISMSRPRRSAACLTDSPR